MIARDHIRRRLSFKAVQPFKKIHKHPQSLQLSGLHRSTKICPSVPHTRVAHKLMVLLLERDGVVEKELWSVFKHLRDTVLW